MGATATAAGDLGERSALTVGDRSGELAFTAAAIIAQMVAASSIS
jgi:hypothetical protein